MLTVELGRGSSSRSDRVPDCIHTYTNHYGYPIVVGNAVVPSSHPALSRLYLAPIHSRTAATQIVSSPPPPGCDPPLSHILVSIFLYSSLCSSAESPVQGLVNGGPDGNVDGAVGSIRMPTAELGVKLCFSSRQWGVRYDRMSCRVINNSPRWSTS